jgi:hypothetical protein
VILLLLAVIWGVFLVPQLLRARADRGPADSIGSFRNQLSMIERSLPEGQARGQARRSFPSAAASSAMPAFGAPVYGAPVAARGIAPSRSELQRRRRDVLLALLAAVIATLALGLVFKPAFALNFVADAAFATYVALLVRARTIAAEREMKVRYLPGPVPAYASASEPSLRSTAR